MPASCFSGLHSVRLLTSTPGWPTILPHRLGNCTTGIAAGLYSLARAGLWVSEKELTTGGTEVHRGATGECSLLGACVIVEPGPSTIDGCMHLERPAAAASWLWMS